MKLTNLLMAAAVAASAAAAVPAAAVEVVFAQSGLTKSEANFRFVRGSGGNGTFYTTSTATANSPGNAAITFSLVDAPSPLSVTANLFLSGSTVGDPAFVTAGSFTQMIDSYTFDITAISDITYNGVTIAAGQSLLSGSVANAAIRGAIGGSTGSMSGSTAGGSAISFSSPLFSFVPNTDYGFAFALGTVSPVFAVTPGRSVSTFRSTISGNFQSEPAPIFGVIPEPGSWAMMIAGMGLVGFARRRRNQAIAA